MRTLFVQAANVILMRPHNWERFSFGSWLKEAAARLHRNKLAIALANDSDYGLGAVLRTNDARLAKRFFEEVQAGTIWINDPLTDNYGGPFGGMKMSGNARELGEEGLESFLETKHVHWDFSDVVKDYWYPY